MKQIAILMVMIGMVGIASANPDPCPEINKWNDKQTSNKVIVVSSHNSDNEYKYYIGGPKETGNSNGAQELCVDSSANPESETVASGLSWSVSHPLEKGFDDQFARSHDGGESSNIPFDGNIHEVGTISWHEKPDHEETLVHIHDHDECAHLYPHGDPDSTGQEGTCFVKPPCQKPPVPELSPLVLTSAGLIGMVFVSRKYKGR